MSDGYKLPPGIHTLKLTNIGPFENFQMDGMVGNMIVMGDNGQGKSTLVGPDGIFRGMFDAHNSYLVRHGCDVGEIYVEFTDQDENFVQSKQTIRKGKSQYDVIVNGTPILKEPKGYLEKLISGILLNPHKFVYGTAKEQLEFFFALYPLVFQGSEILEAVGGLPEARQLPTVHPDDTYDLDFVDSVIGIASEIRKDLKKERDHANSFLLNAQGALPTDAAEESTDWDAIARTKLAELEQQKTILATLESDCKRDLDISLKHLNKDLEGELRTIAEQEELELNAIREAYKQLRQQKRNETKDTEQVLRDTAGSTLSEVATPIRATILTLTSEYATADSKRDSTARNKALRANVDAAKLTFDQKTKKASLAEDSVKDLVELRKQKLEKTHVKGVEFKDGIIYVDGLRLDKQVNESERWRIVFQLIGPANRQSPLPLLCIDLGDNMNTDKLAWIMDLAERAGIQVFASRQKKGADLTILPYEQWKQQELVQERAA